jgi:hypothetical protein
MKIQFLALKSDNCRAVNFTTVSLVLKRLQFHKSNLVTCHFRIDLSYSIMVLLFSVYGLTGLFISCQTFDM